MFLSKAAQKTAQKIASFLLVVGVVAGGNALPATALTPIMGTICQGGIHTPSFSVTSPANGSTVRTATTTITITAHWGRSLVVSRGGTPVATTSLGNLASEIATINVPLIEGSNALSLTITGGCPEAQQTQPLSLFFDPSAATVTYKITNTKSPRLAGYVTAPSSRVFVVVSGTTYEAVNNGDGTWTLPEGTITPDLADGSYDIRVYTTDPSGATIVSDNTQENALVIDTVTPTGTLTSAQDSSQRSPALSGTVSDPSTLVTITINGRTYQATNHGNGTWTLPANVILPLASGTYPLTITFTDQAGNSSMVHTTLHIAASGEIGFILAPNTGYARIGSINIPSWPFYLFLLLTLIVITGKQWQKRRLTAQQSLPPRRRRRT